MEKSGGSRLMQMQARFQQKQMAEREHKIASLYEAQQARALDRVRHSPATTNGNNTASPPAHVPVLPGKVRQMFEERRTMAGRDKSYPLQPIHNNERPALRKAHNGVCKTTTRTSVEKKSSKVESTVRKHKSEILTKDSSDVNHNHEADLNANHKISHRNGNFPLDELDRGDSYRLEDETFPEALAPLTTPRSPQPEPARPPRRSPAAKSSPKPTSQRVPPAPVAPPRRTAAENVTNDSKTQTPMQKASKPVPKRNPVGGSKPRSATATAATRAPTAETPRQGGGGGGGGEPCAVCGRRFAPDRLAKHEDICRRAGAKKRKPFDALKHRLAGTEAEPFINKLRKSAPTNTKQKSKPLNSTWRQKHEEFVSAIRAAKQVQAHLAAGGKLSDLPPPPPSENRDYVQCPHCSRRFNEAAAQRHIPKCASYQYNKPKPNNTKKR